MKRGPITWVIVCLITVAALLGVAAAAYLFCPRPALEEYYPHSRAYFDVHGRLLRLGLARDDRYRLFCPLGRVSPRLAEATILYEDKDFYRHPGVDFPALVRAFWTTYILRTRRVGASTITMQVARLRWRIHTDTLTGKLWQVLRALQLARHYDKDRILEAYLNLAPYGGNIEGIQAASLVYFNKTADQLTLPEALTLAVVPQNPVRRNPAVQKGFYHLRAARQRLFARWLEVHPEDRRHDVFFKLPLAVRHVDQLPFEAPHFVDHLDAGGLRPSDGIIHTTLDLVEQQAMQSLIRDYIARRSAEGVTNAAALALDTRTMALTSMVGSADFFNRQIQGQVNGTTASRSPGSALKPFVYALAMDQGLIHPASLMKDSPRRYGGFTPENFDQRFLGPLSARNALILSRNVPATNLQARLEDPGLHGLLQQAGIGGLHPEAFYGLALSLGGVEVTMLDLAKLYAALANGGRLRPIRMLRERDGEAAAIPILSPEASFLVLDILKDNPLPETHREPLSAAAGNQVAWKTGTSHGFRDAWAVGVSADRVVAVWVGNFNGEGNRAFVGRTAAGPLLFDLIAALVPERGWKVSDAIDFSRANLKTIDVCVATGELPGRYCPHTQTSGFIPGVSPIRVCTVHRAVPVDVATGLRACQPVLGQTQDTVFEFWPSDLMAIFRTAGISLKAPPPFAGDCNLDQRAASGQAPTITSPQSDLVYAVRSERQRNLQIPFNAIADGGVRRIYWFVGHRYVGISEPSRPFMWTSHSGTFDIRTVDDHGRAAHTSLRVEMVQ